MMRLSILSSTLLLLLLIAPMAGGCSGGDGESSDPVAADGGFGADAGASVADGGGGTAVDAGSEGMSLNFTLTSDCATFAGRAVVNFNGNLGISFTDGESPFTFRGSVQFELPSNFGGAVPNPEAWNGSDPRKIVAVTTSDFSLHGNHCWFDTDATPAGSVNITDYRPAEGIVNADFNALRLRSCNGASVCTVSGSIETTGEGVYE